MSDDRTPNGDEAMRNLDDLTDKLFSVVREDDDEIIVEESEATEIVEED
jgi:hypothetical protein